jgi:small subunit ribosomal protein S8
LVIKEEKEEEKMAKRSNVTTDPIADMLTRIRNAIMVRHEGCLIPFSQIKFGIAKILVKEGYIEKVEDIKDEKGHRQLKITFKTTGGTQKVIQGLRRISKPGLRVYAGADELPKVLSGLGIAVISTSKGLMTDKEARDKNLGGEVLAFVW